jgi:ribosomal protein S18 acetylase RimI-like enzyme
MMPVTARYGFRPIDRPKKSALPFLLSLLIECVGHFHSGLQRGVHREKEGTMNDISSAPPVIRDMEPADLDQIIEIDIKVLGKPRPGHWKTKIDMVKKRSPISSLVAEVDGKVVGFIIGGASRWEYGVPENIGWIDTIGVDPEYQRRGIGDILFKEMATHLKKIGVDTINTFVVRRDWRLLKFFGSLGFKEGDMINLELDI